MPPFRAPFFALIFALLFAAPAAAFTLPEDQTKSDFIASNVIATFYHELGHALIYTLELPVLGKEEDAADALSSVMIHQIWDEDAAASMVYDAANAYLLYDAEAQAEGYETPYWDEHSLDLQRYYTLVCLFYGGDTAARQDLADELELPEDRAAGCEWEYQQAEASWGKMLEDLTPSGKAKGLRMRGKKKDDIYNLIAAEVEYFNEYYELPEWVDVEIAKCGEANAYFDSEEMLVTICSEYAEDLDRIYDTWE